MEEIKEEKNLGFSLGDLAKRYKQLPEEISDLLFDPNVGKTIKSAMIVGNLPQEKFSDIMYLVSLVLIGFYHHEDFVQYLAEDVGVDVLIGQKVALEIDKKIFLPRRLILDKLFNLSVDELKDDVEPNKLKEVGGNQALGKFAWPLENKSVEVKPAEKAMPAATEFKPRIFPREIDNPSVTPSLATKIEQKPVEQPIAAAKPVDKVIAAEPKTQPINLNQPKPTLIFGAKAEIRPTLESKPAITSVFGEVKSKQEKPIISELESGGPVSKFGSLFQSFKNKLSLGLKGNSAAGNKPLEEIKSKSVNPEAKNDILVVKPINTPAPVEKKLDNQSIVPTKVVNYSAEEKKPVPTSSLGEVKPVVAPIQAPAPIPKEMATTPAATPVEKKPEKMDDKIVDLKKIKF